jgi:glycosyltransferase involved in cell wall biosynthesis
MAASVWLAERGIPFAYRGRPFEAVSESTAEDLAARGIPRSNIRVIYNGIDLDFFTPDAGARSRTPLFAYVGRLKRYKGVDLILQAFAKLERADANLVIAGAGDYRDHLERLASTLGVSDRVRFAGFISQEEKRDLLRRAWATVFASPKEGWGLTNIEAQACGTPVIASDSPGLRESVVDGETGDLVPHRDIAALAAAMGRYADSPELIELKGNAGRRFAGNFTWKQSADHTITHLNEVVQRGKSKWK